eukprot:3506878-Prymnesium_polylepis.2
MRDGEIVRGGVEGRTIGRSPGGGAACQRASLRVLRRQRLHTRVERQRERVTGEARGQNARSGAHVSGRAPQPTRAAHECLISRDMDGDRAIASLSSGQGLAGEGSTSPGQGSQCLCREERRHTHHLR